MDRTRRTPVIIGSALVVGLLLVGCADTASPETATPSAPPAPSDSGSESPAASPDTPSPGMPSPDPYATPGPDERAIATVVFRAQPEPPEKAVTAGPAVAVADQPVAVTGQCEGDRVDWRLTTADGEQRTLLEGTLACDDPVDDGFDYALAYDGPVQLDLTDTSTVTAAWLRVTPAS